MDCADPLVHPFSVPRLHRVDLFASAPDIHPQSIALSWGLSLTADIFAFAKKQLEILHTQIYSGLNLAYLHNCLQAERSE